MLFCEIMLGVTIQKANTNTRSIEAARGRCGDGRGAPAKDRILANGGGGGGNEVRVARLVTTCSCCTASGGAEH